MTLIKSLMLGSAAGIVAVASAQAADLPTKKGAPAAEYVKVCSITVAGKPVVGFVLPGSDTCFKIGGYVTAQIEGGNVKTTETTDYVAGTQKSGSSELSDAFGFSTRFNLSLDAVSNTAYGPLTSHVELQVEEGSGFDNVDTPGYINTAYVTWAGITAGKAPSFFSFTGGGPGWANFFSPDQQGFNQPDLLAYTASFGGGFSATAAIQQAKTGGGNGNFGGTDFNGLGGPTPDFTFNGVRSPDLVGNLKVSQGWGSAQIGSVAHEVRVTSSINGLVQNTWGWAVDAGVSFNLPTLGPGDDIGLTGAYSYKAAWYSGLPDAMWGEDGAVNGNGQKMALADTYFNPNGIGIATPKAWSITAWVDHYFSPQFSISPEASYGQVRWTGTNGTSMVSDSNSWLVGAVAHWKPVTNLDFEFELLYQDSHTDQPNGFIPGNGVASNASWQKQGDGFAARFEITRYFQ